MVKRVGVGGRCSIFLDLLLISKRNLPSCSAASVWASTVFPSAMFSTFGFLNKLEPRPPSPALSSMALVILMRDGHGSAALGEGFSE